MKNFIRFFLYGGLTIGVPLFYLYQNYELYGQYDAMTKLKMAGMIALVLIFFLAKHFLSALIYSMKLTWKKKLLWGLDRVLPLLAVLISFKTIMTYGDVMNEVLMWTILSNLLAYQVAPEQVLKKKNVTGK
jgi:hypothetical protein